MKYWAQFYFSKKEENSLTEKVGNKIYQQCVGSDSVCILDGRNNICNMKNICIQKIKESNRLHNYSAYRIFLGDHFSENHPLTEITEI